MKRLLLATGLILSIAINLLNTQEWSVADTHAEASMQGVLSASVLNVAPEIKQEPKKPVRPQAKIVEKAAARSLLPAIERSTATREHKMLFNEALQMLPAKCRHTLQNFYVKYEKQEHRGLAGKSVMILDGTVQSHDELRALFIHESGHNFDLGCLTGTPESGESVYADGNEPMYNDDPSLEFYRISWLTSDVQKSNVNTEDFVSGYASYNAFEDFSESFAYFVLQNDVFLERALENEALMRKYVFFRDVLFDGDIPSIATGRSVYTGKVPWDVTKLAYEWHSQTVVVDNR